MIRNIIFDWSGTLVDDFSCVLATTNRLFSRFDRPEMSFSEFRSKFRLPFSEFYAECLPDALEGPIEEVYQEEFLKLRNNVPLLPGARKILDLCKDTHRSCYLLSTIRPAVFENQANRLEIKDLFQCTYTRVLDKREKIREILETHHLNPSETAFVGDMVHDIEAGRHGGVWSVAVLTGFDSQEKLATAHPDLIIRNLDVLCAFL